MGKVVGKIAKVAAVVAVGYFAPQIAAKLAPALLGKAAGGAVMASTLGKAAASAVVGAGIGAAGGAVGVPGLSAKSGALAGGMSGLFGGKPALGGAPANTATDLAARAAQETGMTAAQSVGAGLTTAGTAGAAGAAGIAGLGAGLKAAAPLALGATLAGGLGGSGGQQGEQAELERLREANARFTGERFSQAQRLLSEADRLDPDYMGRQAASEAMIRGSVLKGQALRGLTGPQREAEERRFQLGTARNVGTAYQQGYGTGVAGRAQSRLAGISSIPTAYPVDAFEGGRQLSVDEEKRRAGLSSSLTNIFGTVLNKPSVITPDVIPG